MYSSVSLLEDVYVEVFLTQIRLREEEKKKVCGFLSCVPEEEERIYVSKGVKRRRERLKAKEKMRIVAERVSSAFLDKWREGVSSIFKVVISDGTSKEEGEMVVLVRDDSSSVHLFRTKTTEEKDTRKSLEGMSRALEGDRSIGAAVGTTNGLRMPHLELKDEALCLVANYGLDIVVSEAERIGPAILVSGSLAGVNVMVLLDSGAQTNLVSRSFLENNQHLFLREGSLRVRFGNNEEAVTMGEYHNLSLSVQGQAVTVPIINVSPFIMSGVDLILGTPFWVSTGGGLYIDAEGGHFKFPTGKIWHSISGLGTLESADIQMLQGVRNMRRYFKKNQGQLDRYLLQISCLKVSAVDLKKASAGGVINPQVQEILREFSDVCRDDLPVLREREQGADVDEAFLKIPLKEGATPKMHRPFPMSHGEILVLQQMLAELMEKHYIEETDNSSGWSAPIFLLRKPGQRDGVLQQFRLIVDFRALNAVTETATYIPPDVRQLVMDLKGAKIFSISDCITGYYQMALAEADRAKTTFACHTPQGVKYYRFRVACLGLSGAVAGFQLFMEKILRGLEDRVRAYIDDFIIFTKDMKTHLETIRILMGRLREHGVYINLKKCQWAVPEVEFLGLLISHEKVDVTEEKRQALRDYETPKDYPGVRRFVGFANYLSPFVPHFSGTIAPLTDLIKGDTKGKRMKFQWSVNCQEAFDTIRSALISATGIYIPQEGYRYAVETDASLLGVGAALYQVVGDRYRPIWFASHKLNKAERNYAPRDVELLGVVFALKKFRQYLALIQFDLYCDHESLALFKSQDTLKGKDWRWASLISEFNFVHYYRKGETMLVPDALSRAVEEKREPVMGVEELVAGLKKEDLSQWSSVDLDSVCLRTADNRIIDARMCMIFPMAVVDTNWRTTLSEKYAQDPEMHAIILALAKDPKALTSEEKILVRDFSYREDALWYCPIDGLGKAPRLCIPRIPGNGPRLLAMFDCHDGFLHQGLEKSYFRLSAGFYWKGMKRSLSRYIRSCESCSVLKSKNTKAETFRAGHHIPGKRWEVVAVDFITDLQETEEGFNCILVVVDTVTKFTYLIPSCKTDTAEDSAWRIFAIVFSVHGLPRVLQSDRDSKWCSEWFTALMKCFNVRQSMGTSYDHKFNGVVEVLNKTVEVCLRSVLSNYPDREFTEYLPLVQLAINSAVHSATGVSPYYAMFGVEPCNPALFVAHSEVRGELPDDVEEFVKFQEGVLAMTRDALSDSQRAVAMFANRSESEKHFEVGEMVLLNTVNLSKMHFKRKEGKMRPPFMGPFEVEERLRSVTGKEDIYRLKLPASMKRLYPVFHAVLLEKYKGGAVEEQEPDEFQDRLFLEEKQPKEDTVEENCVEEAPRTAELMAPMAPEEKSMQKLKISKKSVRWEFEEILKRERHGRKKDFRYLVRWVGYGPEQDSWVDRKMVEEDGLLLLDSFDKKCDAEEQAQREFEQVPLGQRRRKTKSQ